MYNTFFNMIFYNIYILQACIPVFNVYLLYNVYVNSDFSMCGRQLMFIL